MAALCAAEIAERRKGLEMRGPRGVFELFVGTLGDVADTVHRWLGAWMPRWARFTIAVFWDCVDIMTRILFWPFFLLIPGLGPIVRGLLDIALVFLGAVLWGSPGLLQTFELAMEFIPGVGWFVDLMPMLTIAGFVARRREREAQEEAQEDEYEGEDEPPPPPAAYGRKMPVEILYGVVALVVGLILWLAGVVSFGWFMAITGFGLLAGLTVRLLWYVDIPARTLGWIAATVGFLLAVDLAFLGYFAWLTTPADYRKAAWEELVAAGDGRIKLAERADKLGESVSAGEIAEAAKGAARKFGDWLAGGIREQDPAEAGNPAVAEFGNWLRKQLKGQPAEKKPETTPPPQAARIAKEASEMKLGRAQSWLYGMDFVLDRARGIRNRPISFLEITAVVLIGALGLVGFVAAVEAYQRRFARPDVQPGFDFRDHLG